MHHDAQWRELFLRQPTSLMRTTILLSIMNWQGGFAMATATISPKFQIVIPKEVREKLHLAPSQRLQVVEKGGVITLVPEVPLKSLRGALKGMSSSDLREKKDRM
jgi:AbrB family looped-hinge helix DNA binding protein